MTNGQGRVFLSLLYRISKTGRLALLYRHECLLKHQLSLIKVSTGIQCVKKRNLSFFLSRNMM